MLRNFYQIFIQKTKLDISLKKKIIIFENEQRNEFCGSYNLVYSSTFIAYLE